MAQISMRYKQDLPPKGGYPGISWQRNLPKRGYSGMTLFAAATGIISGGFVLLIRHIRRQRFEKIQINVSVEVPWEKSFSCVVISNVLFCAVVLLCMIFVLNIQGWNECTHSEEHALNRCYSICFEVNYQSEWFRDLCRDFSTLIL